MTYAINRLTKQDIIDVYGEDLLFRIADRDNDGILDEVAIEKALSNTAGVMGSYIAMVSDLPLPAAAKILPMLKILNVDMAVYQLAGNLVTEQEEKRNDAALKLLQKIAEGGKMSLGLPVADQPVASDGGLMVNAPGKIFGRDKLSQY